MKVWIAISAAAIVLFSFSPKGWSQSEEVLYAFSGGADGGTPYSTLTFDSSGNLYGTTFNGGAGAGAVYELSSASGTWKETVLFSFNGTDGYGPYGGVVFDREGNLYGTTTGGGAHGSGTVYELKRTSNGLWKEAVLHSFEGSQGGDAPEGNLVFDDAGNLYGTTFYGGKYGKGMAWRLSPNSRGGWTSRILHSFGSGTDGANPSAGVILDSEGNAYGTTWIGGENNAGVIFELAPTPASPWKERILYNFSGIGSAGGLIFDAQGNLYGTSFENLVFKLMKSSGDKWVESSLASVENGPESTLVFDTAGNLYGTTLDGGTSEMGSVFELSPATGDTWTQTLLYSFVGGSDGSRADVGLTLDSAGNLYGTTYAGGGTGCGGSGCGVVFQVKP